MAENSKIEWCHHTFNPWRGCTKIAPGCQNCYADAMSKRNPGTLGVWGPNGTRVVASESMWQQPLKWDRLAKEAGERHRVFCASLADVFEDWQGPMMAANGKPLWRCHGSLSNSPIPSVGLEDGCRMATMADVRERLFDLIDETPNLDWLLVTKRPESVRRMWPQPVNAHDYGSWGQIDRARRLREFDRDKWHRLDKAGFRPNVWLLTSVSDQPTADAMIPHLLACRDLCPVLGLSAEPLLGPVDLHSAKCRETGSCPTCPVCLRNIDWVIVGGESGHGARPYDVAWARSIIGQCQTADVPVFHKQLGAIAVDSAFCEKDGTPGILLGIKDKKGGDMAEWPEDLRVRQYPTTKEMQ